MERQQQQHQVKMTSLPQDYDDGSARPYLDHVNSSMSGEESNLSSYDDEDDFLLDGETTTTTTTPLEQMSAPVVLRSTHTMDYDDDEDHLDELEENESNNDNVNKQTNKGTNESGSASTVATMTSHTTNSGNSTSHNNLKESNVLKFTDSLLKEYETKSSNEFEEDDDLLTVANQKDSNKRRNSPTQLQRQMSIVSLVKQDSQLLYKEHEYSKRRVAVSNFKTRGDSAFQCQSFREAKYHYLEALSIQKFLIKTMKSEEESEVLSSSSALVDDSKNDTTTSSSNQQRRRRLLYYQKQMMKEQHVEGDLHMSIGLTYGACNKIKRAEEYFRKALHIYQHLVEEEATNSRGSDSSYKPILHTFARSANKIGNLFYRHHRFTTALSFYKMAQESPYYPVLPSASSGLNSPTRGGGGTDNYRRRNSDSEDEENEESSSNLHLWEQNTTEGIMEKNLFLCRADTLNNMANVYNVTGEYSKAIHLYHQAMDIQAAVLKNTDDSEGIRFTTLHNIASCYCREGKYDMALKTYRSVIYSCADKHGHNDDNNGDDDDHHYNSNNNNPSSNHRYQERIVDSMAGLAVTLHSLGETHQAIEAYLEGLQLIESMSSSGSQKVEQRSPTSSPSRLKYPSTHYNPYHVKVAGLHNAIGELYEEIFNKSKALEHYRRGYAIYVYNRCHRKEPEMRRCRKNLKRMGILDPDHDDSMVTTGLVETDGSATIPLKGMKPNYFAFSEVVNSFIGTNTKSAAMEP